MKVVLCLAGCLILVATALGQARVHSQPGSQTQPATTAPAAGDNESIEQMRTDVQRLKVILNQMRTNLAFVDSSQSPLKHEFELQADAWQIVIEQMDRRLKRMEESRPASH